MGTWGRVQPGDGGYLDALAGADDRQAARLVLLSGVGTEFTGGASTIRPVTASSDVRSAECVKNWSTCTEEVPRVAHSPHPRLDGLNRPAEVLRKSR
jgi:hypothetical protein